LPGSYYIAVTGMRARLDSLDRLAGDIANVSTAGYKAERQTTEQADRPDFGDALKSAIDVTNGDTRIDFRPGGIAPTGRDLDLAIEGKGFFELDTPSGPRYTRDGRFMRRADGLLTTMDGDAVRGTAGPITVPKGPLTVDPDGAIRSDGNVVGSIKVVDFATPDTLVKEGAYRFRNEGPAPNQTKSAEVRGGALEQSNVSSIDRVVELTSVLRSFEALQKAVTLLANDVDGRAISELGRR
jgi:flagellar basal-body rod protein FlgF